MPIVLHKKGAQHQIKWQKDDLQNTVTIKLTWSNKAPVDLDLGCYYELRNGKRQLIDALQFGGGMGGPRDAVTKQGCFTAPPYIWHTGDDRGKKMDSSESIIVNTKGLLYIRRIMVYAYIYEGVPNWKLTDAVVTVNIPKQETVAVKMGEIDDNSRFCAIAQLDFDKDCSVTVRRLVTFHDTHSACDKQYGWGFHYNKVNKD